MREIKFRAWECNLKEMICVDDIQFHRSDDVEIDGIILKPKPRGEQPVMINTRSAWRIADNEDVILMQYTGLKDKNGVEIYEGDIVRRDLDEDIGKVEMDEGVFTMSGDCQLPLFQETVEVIGNIYENPNLLK